METDLWKKGPIYYPLLNKVFKRNTSALTLLRDLDVCFNDVTLLKIKYIYLKEKYGEGDILHEAKTGTGPVLFTCSLAYVSDYLVEHRLLIDYFVIFLYLLQFKRQSY